MFVFDPFLRLGVGLADVHAYNGDVRDLVHRPTAVDAADVDRDPLGGVEPGEQAGGLGGGVDGAAALVEVAPGMGAAPADHQVEVGAAGAGPGEPAVRQRRLEDQA